MPHPHPCRPPLEAQGITPRAHLRPCLAQRGLSLGLKPSAGCQALRSPPPPGKPLHRMSDGLKRAKPMFSRQGDRARPHGAQWVGGSPGSDSQPSRFTRHDRVGTGIRSGQGSCENPTQCQKLASKSYQSQTGSYHPFSFPTCPPQKELRETQCQGSGR